MTTISWGEQLFSNRGCIACHRIDGGEGAGPPLDELARQPRALADGSERDADRDYLRRSLLAPNDEVVAGYRPVMPSYQGILSADQLDALLDYLESLSAAAP